MKSRLSVAPAQGSRPSLSERKSSLGTTRKSSIQPRSSVVTGRSDPRNITDKRFIHASIRSLIDYLTMHNYDNSISPKILTNPSTKDFNNIVQFLFRQIDPNFAYTGKYEDEVISMFKYLRYPYSISKTALNAVGSPHSWPQLLACVMWLIELLAYDEEAATGQVMDSDGDDSAVSDKAFLSYLHTAYGCFLGGDDSMYTQLEERFVESFESKNQAAVDETKAFDLRNENLSREIDDLGERMKYLPDLQEKKKIYVKDVNKFQNLIQELQRYKRELEGKISSGKQELDRTTTSLANTDREVEELRQRIAGQELSPEDVRRLCDEREHIESALTSAQISRSNLESRVHEAERLLRSKVLDLEEVMRTYAVLGEDLQLLPRNARNAQGKDLTLDIDTRAKKRSDLLRCDIRGNVVPVLKSLRLDLADVTASIRDQSDALAEEVEETDTKYSEQADRAANLDNRIQRADELYRREKELYDAAMSSHAAQVAELEERLLQCRDAGADESRISLASRRTVEARAHKTFRRDEHQRTRKELMDSIMDVITKCADHRELVERKQEEIRGQYSGKLEMLLSEQFERVNGQGVLPTSTRNSTPMHHNSAKKSTKVTANYPEASKLISDSKDVNFLGPFGETAVAVNLRPMIDRCAESNYLA